MNAANSNVMPELGPQNATVQTACAMARIAASLAERGFRVASASIGGVDVLILASGTQPGDVLAEDFVSVPPIGPATKALPAPLEPVRLGAKAPMPGQVRDGLIARHDLLTTPPHDSAGPLLCDH